MLCSVMEKAKARKHVDAESIMYTGLSLRRQRSASSTSDKMLAMRGAAHRRKNIRLESIELV